MYIQVILMEISENLLKSFFAIQKEILPKCSQRICLGLKMNEIGLTCLFFF